MRERLEKYSILHLSDLHRDPANEVDSHSLLQSIERDIDSLVDQGSLPPSLCVVSGDLVYGATPGKDADAEVERQYQDALEFLVGLADQHFKGDRERIVLTPGNHDVSFDRTMASMDEESIAGGADLAALATELFAQHSKLRWRWSNFTLYRIKRSEIYQSRLEHFSNSYQAFYQNKRSFSLLPEEQYAVFDFPELSLSIVALNSCDRNDPLNRVGSIHPRALSAALDALRAPSRAGWMRAATWHHSMLGGAQGSDQLDPAFLQVLIQDGVSMGFHGHQHRTDCVEERYKLGTTDRKISVVSAASLCAGPAQLSPGIPRGYNLIEVDRTAGIARVHQRQMMQGSNFSSPIWGPGLFPSTGRSFLDSSLSSPISSRPKKLDFQLALEKADELMGARSWEAAISALDGHAAESSARAMIVAALEELHNSSMTIAKLMPPQTIAECVALGEALLESGNLEVTLEFLALPLVHESTDASVEDVRRRLTRRSVK